MVYENSSVFKNRINTTHAKKKKAIKIRKNPKRLNSQPVKIPIEVSEVFQLVFIDFNRNEMLRNLLFSLQLWPQKSWKMTKGFCKFFLFRDFYMDQKKVTKKEKKRIFTNVVISTEKISFPTCIYFKIFHRLRIDICVPLSANFIKWKIRSEILIEIDNFARQWWLHVGTIVLSVYVSNSLSVLPLCEC